MPSRFLIEERQKALICCCLPFLLPSLFQLAKIEMRNGGTSDSGVKLAAVKSRASDSVGGREGGREGRGRARVGEMGVCGCGDGGGGGGGVDLLHLQSVTLSRRSGKLLARTSLHTRVRTWRWQSTRRRRREIGE